MRRKLKCSQIQAEKPSGAQKTRPGRESPSWAEALKKACMEDAGGWASGPSLRAEGETGNRSRLPMAGAHVSGDRGSKGTPDK